LCRLLANSDSNNKNSAPRAHGSKVSECECEVFYSLGEELNAKIKNLREIIKIFSV
jgi:hypothetical protein